MRASWSDPHGNRTAYLSRDIQAGIDSGRFDIPNLGAALDVVFGSVMGAIHAVSENEAPEEHVEAIAGAILMALGISKTVAHPMPKVVLPWQREDEVEL